MTSPRGTKAELAAEIAELRKQIASKDRQIAELQTILEAYKSDLTEALDQQTATADILRAISQSPTEVQPVFDAIERVVPNSATHPTSSS